MAAGMSAETQGDRRTDSLRPFFLPPCLLALGLCRPYFALVHACLVFALPVSGLLLRGLWALGLWYDDDDDRVDGRN